MKALLIEQEVHIKRTHDIFELNLLLIRNNIQVDISEEECDLINVIYLPTKYPIGSALPDFVPTYDFCVKIVEIANRVFLNIKNQF